MPPATTIFIIDADAAFVHTVSALGKSMGLEICWFSSGEEFFRQFDSERPGCLVLEVRLSDMSGLDVQQRLKAMPISPPIIFVVAKADVPTVVRAKRMGAVNFMLKQSISETELWESIRTAIERDAADRAVHEHRRSQLERLSRLTGPERQVLDLLLSGNSNRHIAEVLGVTRRAAESRRARLMRKLGANSLPDLVRFGIDAGLFGAVEGEPEA